VTPACSIITPTWQRHGPLLGRCIPSVNAQDYAGRMEHIVVSDGPDDELGSRIGWKRPMAGRYAQLPDHDPGVPWGLRARLHALSLATGDLIAYLDDDDAYRPGHVGVLARALAGNPDAGFAYSRMRVHLGGGKTMRFGDGSPAYGRIGTDMIMHRRDLLDVATWSHDDLADDTAWSAAPVPVSEDWSLVRRWLDAGISYVSVDAETVDYYPATPPESPACAPPWAPAEIGALP
jgi:glycosyltransferase involved in cell wall biosynthesis